MMMTDRAALDYIRNLIDSRIEIIDDKLVKVGSKIAACQREKAQQGPRVLYDPSDNDLIFYGSERSELTQERRQLELIRQAATGQKLEKAVETLFIRGCV